MREHKAQSKGSSHWEHVSESTTRLQTEWSPTRSNTLREQTWIVLNTESVFGKVTFRKISILELYGSGNIFPYSSPVFLTTGNTRIVPKIASRTGKTLNSPLHLNITTSCLFECDLKNHFAYKQWSKNVTWFTGY